MTSAKETEKERCYRELVDKARVLENRLEMLLKVPQPVVDADYDSCFVEAHKQLTAEKKPSPLPQPLLRARLVQSLKEENDSLKRLVAEFNGQLSAARREIADLEARDEPTAACQEKATAALRVPEEPQPTPDCCGSQWAGHCKPMPDHRPDLRPTFHRQHAPNTGTEIRQD